MDQPFSKPLHLWILLGLVMQVSLAHAANVYKYDSAKQVIFLKEVNSTDLAVDAEVCLYTGKLLTGCGKVTGLVRNAAVVALKEVKETPVVGAEVAIRASGRGLSSTAAMTETFNKPTALTMGLAAGITAGATYFYPNLHVQLVVARNWTIGLMPMFAKSISGSSTVTAYGGYLTVGYYHTHSALRGLEFEVGGGAFSIEGTSAGVSQSVFAPGGKATVGWRGKALWDLGLDLGVAAGVQYISIPANTVTIAFSGLVPMLNAYVGYSF
jgi:hypothetical protein